MRPGAILVLAAAALVLAAPARGDAICEVPAEMVRATDALPVVRRAVREKVALRVVVIGSASSEGPGAPERAYPARSLAALRERLPGLEATLVNLSRRGQTAAEMVRRFPAEVIAAGPTLVVWQTGTVEAVRGIDLADFATSLIAGLGFLRSAGVDALLVDPQYSPRTAALASPEAYAEAMRQVAESQGVPLFPRLAIMQHWVDEGALDLTAATREGQRRVAEQVHDCIGRLLAETIVSAIAD